MITFREVPSPNEVNFTFPNENGNYTEENLDKDLPFINTQESPKLTKSQVSFNNPKSESPLVLNNYGRNLRSETRNFIRSITT